MMLNMMLPFIRLSFFICALAVALYIFIDRDKIQHLIYSSHPIPTTKISPQPPPHSSEQLSKQLKQQQQQQQAPPYITDVTNNFSTINEFNKRQLLPRLKSIVTMDYFRFVKLNINKPCGLWGDDGKCSLRDCKVKLCDKCPYSEYDEAQLSAINTDVERNQLDLLVQLFECSEQDDDNAQYVDLLLNPERYTGYSGEPANRVWRSIYEENCFIHHKHKNPLQLEQMCYEERLFYQAISGLHTSINIHLSAEYPLGGMDADAFGPNLEEFTKRFEGKNDYIRNLYFLYQLELRALAKCEPFLMTRVNWQSNADLKSTRDAIKDLLKITKSLNNPFNESMLFKDKPNHVAHELALHFKNITTTIMDCVACDKCKLWGKVQLHGLGAAFKILSIKDINQLSLNRQEIISLVNAIARLSNSIRQLEVFKTLLEELKNQDPKSKRKVQQNPLPSTIFGGNGIHKQLSPF